MKVETYEEQDISHRGCREQTEDSGQYAVGSRQKAKRTEIRIQKTEVSRGETEDGRRKGQRARGKQ